MGHKGNLDDTQPINRGTARTVGKLAFRALIVAGIITLSISAGVVVKHVEAEYQDHQALTATFVFPTQVAQRATQQMLDKTQESIERTLEYHTQVLRTAQAKERFATRTAQAQIRSTQAARRAPTQTAQARIRATKAKTLNCYAGIHDTLRGKFDAEIIISPPDVHVDLYRHNRQVDVLGQHRGNYSNTGEAYILQYYSSYDLKPGSYELRARYRGRSLRKAIRLEEGYQYELRVEC